LTQEDIFLCLPVLRHHLASFDAVQLFAAQVQYRIFQLTQEDIFLCLPVVQHRSDSSNTIRPLDAQVRHRVLQLMREDIFLYRLNPSLLPTQLFLTPFGSYAYALSMPLPDVCISTSSTTRC
jgi:hypothetical protein